MASKKAHEVDRWLEKPDSKVRVILLYGPDRGLVSERASLLAAKSGLSTDDPFSVVRMDGAEIEKQAGRLVDEAHTVPMFSEQRLIWVRNAGASKTLSDDVKTLCEKPPRDATILIEAGDLKKSSPLRNAVEAAGMAIALPCFADQEKALGAIIDEALRKAGMTITLEARQALHQSLGGDRLASRGEIDKLVLFALGQGEITLEDVIASIGDVARLSVDEVIDPVLEGKRDAFDLAFARLAASGNQTYPVLAAAVRQFQAIHVMCADMSSGGQSPSSVVAAARPPIFFSRRKTIENALKRWDTAGVARILERLQHAVLQSRRRPELSEAITRHTLLAITLDRSR